MKRFAPLPLLLLLALPLHAGVEHTFEAPRFAGERFSANSTHVADPFSAAAPLAGDSLPLVRCAALYRSVRVHAGRAALGQDRWDRARTTEARLARAATVIRTTRLGQTWQNADVAAESDITALTSLYLARYEANVLNGGLPWSTDPLWAQDNAICRTLIGAI